MAIWKITRSCNLEFLRSQPWDGKDPANICQHRQDVSDVNLGQPGGRVLTAVINGGYCTWSVTIYVMYTMKCGPTFQILVRHDLYHEMLLYNVVLPKSGLNQYFLKGLMARWPLGSRSKSLANGEISLGILGIFFAQKRKKNTSANNTARYARVKPVRRSAVVFFKHFLLYFVLVIPVQRRAISASQRRRFFARIGRKLHTSGGFCIEKKTTSPLEHWASSTQKDTHYTSFQGLVTRRWRKQCPDGRCYWCRRLNKAVATTCGSCHTGWERCIDIHYVHGFI